MSQTRAAGSSRVACPWFAPWVRPGLLRPGSRQVQTHARPPFVWHIFVLVPLLEVEGGKVDVVAKGKEQYPPRMAGTVEDWAMFAPSERGPVPDFPRVVYLGFGLVVGQLGLRVSTKFLHQDVCLRSVKTRGIFRRSNNTRSDVLGSWQRACVVCPSPRTC